MSVKIITDSASDLLPPYPSNVAVLPLTVTFGENSYREGIDISHHEFYKKLIECEELPITSQINPSAFEEAFASAINAGEEVVCITISSKLSGTYQSACIAAASFAGKVTVVDSLSAAMGEAILVLRAAELCEQGLYAEELIAQIEKEKNNICIVALLDTLEYLKRGGRLSAKTAFVGGLLGIKPVISIQNGEVVVLGKAKGSKNGNNFLVEMIEKAGGVNFDMPYLLGYTGLDDSKLKKYIEDSNFLWEANVQSLPVSTIGGAIGTHIGPGAIGVAFFARERG